VAKLTDGITPAVIPAGATTVTKDQIAMLAQVDPRTVARWAALNQIPGRIDLPGRAVRFNRTAVEQWLAGRK
jgi:excisionase family DNA binding protein